MMLAEQIEPGLLKDMATLRRQITEREVPSVLGGLIEPGKEVRQRWADAPMSAKRTAARALLCPQWFGELRVHRSPRRGRTRVPAEQRVRFFRRLRSTPPPIADAYGWPRAIANDADEIVRRLLDLNREITAGTRTYEPFGAPDQLRLIPD